MMHLLTEMGLWCVRVLAFSPAVIRRPVASLLGRAAQQTRHRPANHCRRKGQHPNAPQAHLRQQMHHGRRAPSGVSTPRGVLYRL